MYETIYIFIGIISILVIIGIIIALIFYKKKKEIKKEEINYQAFFHLGFVWIPVGVVFMITVNPALGMAFLALGVSYIAIGLANRDKWKNPKE